MKIVTYLLGAVWLVAGHVLCQDCAADGTCDTHERCSVWKEEGECIRNKKYMAKHCPVSCAEDSLTLKSIRSQADCEDAHPRCPVWAKLGDECDNNADMRKYCAKSCDTCPMAVSDGESLCRDTNENCRFWADSGECSNNPSYMRSNCAMSCGTCDKIANKAVTKTGTRTRTDEEVLAATAKFGERQLAEGGDAVETLALIEDSVTYMTSDQVMSLPATIRENCRNKNELCSFWAYVGECEANQSFMKINCAPACKTCHLIDMSTRCPPLPDDTEPAFRPGDLNKMFERIVATAPGNATNPSQKLRLLAGGMSDYTVHVKSRPHEAPETEVSSDLDKSNPPWVITFDNFVSPEECDTLIELGYKTGYKRSEDVGKENLDGTVEGKKSKGRTSENAWCSSRNGCRREPMADLIHKRIAKVLGIPAENSEDFQILRYEVGQFYNTHHDYIPHQRDRQCGPRILTFFIYLSDVEAGGGTNFPDLGITVNPKKGSALLWPSVLDADPGEVDPRTRHQALPVEAGTKFAMNGWIHLFNYVDPQERGCN